MGANSSKSSSEGDSGAASTSGHEKMQELNRTLLNKIENPTGSTPGDNDDDKSSGPKVPSLPRQQYMDSSIQGKIREELARLRKHEADVQKQIESAIEKESYDTAAQAAPKGGKAKSSILLKQELDDVRGKIERHNQRRAKVDKAPGVQKARDSVIQCYSTHPGQTLECWAEVRDFRTAVARAESDFVASLST